MPSAVTFFLSCEIILSGETMILPYFLTPCPTVSASSCRILLPSRRLSGDGTNLGEVEEAHDQTPRFIWFFSFDYVDYQLCECPISRYTILLHVFPAKFTCKVCKKEFKKVDSLRRHKWIHASHKPVLVCPKKNCQAYFSTTFNLQHHIRKVHLELLKYKCSFPDCPRMFAMRVRSMWFFLNLSDNWFWQLIGGRNVFYSSGKHGQTSASSRPQCHGPEGEWRAFNWWQNVELLNIFLNTQQKRQRAKKPWQKRLNGNQQPLVEENLRRLFALRMRISRRAKVETNLSSLFNERKIPHFVDSEVNLRDLFGIKQQSPLVVKPEVAPVNG